MRSHEARREKKVKLAEAAASGSVKLRTQDKDGNWVTLTKAQSDAVRAKERNEPDAVRLIVVDSDDDDDDEEMAETMMTANDTEPPTGKTPEDERGEDENGEDESGVRDDDPEQTADGEEGRDDDPEQTADGEDEEEAQEWQGRHRNWSVYEKVAVLDAWNEKSMGKKAFCRHISNKYKRKFDRTQLKRLLAREKEIRESGGKKGADRRFQSTHREKSGKYTKMEWSLAAWIRNMRDMGIVVETWMVNAEARTLLHQHYPIEFPQPPSDDGTDEDSFPFKCR